MLRMSLVQRSRNCKNSFVRCKDKHPKQQVWCLNPYLLFPICSDKSRPLQWLQLLQPLEVQSKRQWILNRSSSFEQLSASAGIASDEMIKAMRKASVGTVSDFNLMSAANKAYSLGVVSNTEQMTTLMEIARVKGSAM